MDKYDLVRVNTMGRKRVTQGNDFFPQNQTCGVYRSRGICLAFKELTALL